MTAADKCLSRSLLLKVEKILTETKGEDLCGFLKDIKDAKLGEGELQRELDSLNGALRCQLSSCFGSQANLSPTCKLMDDAAILTLWDTLKELARRKTEDQKLTIDAIESTFNSNPFLERVPGRDVDSTNQPLIIKHSDSFSKLLDSDGSKEKGRPHPSNAVSDWFNNLIRNNKAVRRVTENFIEEIQKIVSGTGSNADSNLEFLDVGVLRFPDFENPYIQVYHIQLTAWTKYRKPHVLGRKTRRSGFNGEYHLREYKPREELFEGLREEMRKVAVREAEKLIQDLAETPAP
ncbi:hypothetical protein H1R20_g2690, partial [Candolleomyces eurysporus]